MRIVVTGAAGRLGAEVSRALTEAGHDVAALTHADLDICDGAAVVETIRRLQPETIVNCTAYNAVDAAETDRARAYAVNADAPSLLGALALATDACIVHYSTDFVFDGETTEPYEESTPPNPLNVYGASKLAGEREVRCARRHYVLRLESVFGGPGPGAKPAMIDRIAQMLAMGQPVRAFVDRTVSPSYVPDVVGATLALLERQAPYGTYHCVTSGYATWYELAAEVARQLGVPARLEPVLAASVPAAAVRPRFCALSNRKLTALGIRMSDWQAAIGRHLAGVNVRATGADAAVSVA